MLSRKFRVRFEAELDLPFQLSYCESNKTLEKRLSEDVKDDFCFPLFELAQFYGGSSQNLKIDVECVGVQNP